MKWQHDYDALGNPMLESEETWRLILGAVRNTLILTMREYNQFEW